MFVLCFKMEYEKGSQVLHFNVSFVQRSYNKHFWDAKFSNGGRPCKLTNRIEMSYVRNLTMRIISIVKKVCKTLTRRIWNGSEWRNHML